jgi:hypothetical protein
MKFPRPLVSALLACMALAFPAMAQGPKGSQGPKGPAWTPRDSLQAAEFLRLLRERPERLDSALAAPGNFSQETELGFGYRLQEVWVNPAGKLGFSLKVLRQDTPPRGSVPKALEAKPVMNYAALAYRCHAVLKSTFVRDPGAAAGGVPAYRPYHWNLDGAASPLPADSLGLAEAPPPQAVREALAYYMTPFSGTTYGIRGGRGGQILENRDRFLSLADTLMPDKSRALWLLRSLNPASRLTAAEFILRHKAAFPGYEQLLQTALKRVFANPSKVETMRGDAVTREDARKLAFEYSHAEVKRTGRGVYRQ